MKRETARGRRARRRARIRRRDAYRQQIVELMAAYTKAMMDSMTIKMGPNRNEFIVTIMAPVSFDHIMIPCRF